MNRLSLSFFLFLYTPTLNSSPHSHTIQCSFSLSLSLSLNSVLERGEGNRESQSTHTHKKKEKKRKKKKKNKKHISLFLSFFLLTKSYNKYTTQLTHPHHSPHRPTTRPRRDPQHYTHPYLSQNCFVKYTSSRIRRHQYRRRRHPYALLPTATHFPPAAEVPQQQPRVPKPRQSAT